MKPIRSPCDTFTGSQNKKGHTMCHVLKVLTREGIETTFGFYREDPGI
jgi:hypothetical protein